MELVLQPVSETEHRDAIEPSPRGKDRTVWAIQALLALYLLPAVAVVMAIGGAAILCGKLADATARLTRASATARPGRPRRATAPHLGRNAGSVARASR